ncbi:hypothetical protein [Mesorhizobium sp. B2-1-3A]|uniref:hypothetical protein n=1 Tax=Mesorhizobium sp. B2-1-3A TaxID=2589971 RepID=UPI00112CE828|nr:hypothetical protein [Mesorhizobium sp. B2-1-3A]TPM89838.1 hypothetical protein FJ977_35245 [Mesorhizobium sp. B2-1-3A]
MEVWDRLPEIFVSGLSHIDLLGNGCAGFVCYRNVPDERGTICQVPRVNIIMPMLQVPDAVRKSLLIPVHDHGTIKRIRPQWLH